VVFHSFVHWPFRSRWNLSFVVTSWHSFGKIQICRNNIEIFWIPTIAFKNYLFPVEERTKQLSVQHALCDCLISKNKPFEHRSITSFAKVDTTVSTHSTNIRIRSAVQNSCCSCTDSITALHSVQFHFASLFCPPWPLQFRPSWLAWGLRSFGSPHHDNVSQTTPTVKRNPTKW